MRISVQDVDELVLLNGSDEACAAFRISGEVLSRDNAADAGLPKGFEVEAVELVQIWLVLEDSDTTGIASHNDII